MEKAVAESINKHMLNYLNARRGRFILKASLPPVPLSGFHQWADGRDFVGGALVANSNGLASWLLFLLWNDTEYYNEYYLIIFPEDKSRPITEIHDIRENESEVTLQWQYVPKKRDGKNQERKNYFIRYFGDLIVSLTVPLQQSDVQDLLDEVFALAEIRIKADNLDLAPPSFRNGFPEGFDDTAPRHSRKVTTATLLSDLEDQIENERIFEPHNIAEARERILRSVALRRGQREFRQRLIDAYGGRCAVTGCDAIEAIEAAHILPFSESGINSLKNGLLLRADIHTLFDLRLIAVDATKNPPRLLLSEALHHTTDASLEGSRIRLPGRPEHRPSKKALAKHRAEAGL
jgi:HNH endonuclease